MSDDATSERPLSANRPPTAAAREDRFIEFKSEYLPQTDPGKRKFLRSIAAFANCRGGDLVLGMAETSGVAVGVKALDITDPDQCRLQILDLIRSHLRPPLGGVQVHPVALSGGGNAIVIRVPKSWAGPHMLTYNDERRFYIRGDGGKRPMEYEEVREGFLAGEAIGTRLRNFRMERCAAILNDVTPGILASPTRIVIHLLPFDMFALPQRFDVRDLHSRCHNLETIVPSNVGRCFDLEGCYTSDRSEEGDTHGYAYVFRSGALEAVDAYLLRASGEVVAHTSVEGQLQVAVDRYVALLQSLGILGPFALFLTFLNVKGLSMVPPGSRRGAHPFHRDHLYLPEAVLASVPKRVSSALFQVFNSLWNACGMPQSPNYDEQGNRKSTL